MKYREKLHVFKNGLSLIFLKSSGLYAGNFSIRFNVGSSKEEREWGISHLLEHEIFKGTSKYNYQDIADLFYNISANQNAHTDKDFTEFEATLPSKNIPKCMEIF